MTRGTALGQQRDVAQELQGVAEAVLMQGDDGSPGQPVVRAQ